MKFGLTLENFGANLSPKKLIETAKKAEESGFESFWTVDHVMQQSGGHMVLYDNISEVIITLAFLAGYTEKIKLGVSTLVLPLRNPIVVAKQLATLDYLTNERMVMTFGAGWNSDEFNNIGMDFKNRGKRFNESIEVVKALWRGERSFGGTLYQFENASFLPVTKGLSKQPIIIAGNSEFALKRAIKQGDGWHPAAVTGKEIAEQIAPYLDEIGNRDFQLSVHVLLQERDDLEKMVNEYIDYGISRIVFDYTRGDIKPQDREKYLEQLCEYVRNY